MPNHRISNRKKAGLTYLSAFFLPLLLMLTIFIILGIYPFGDKSLLIIDMNSEYVDYLAQMNDALHTGGSFLHNWNMGMGLGMLGLIAFYTASPFNLLILLLPVEWITELILLITLLKVALAGLSFAVFTRYTLQRTGVFALTFSCAYAMSGYIVAYASNIMWLDGAAFLPFVLLGVEKLLRENKYGTFFVSLIYIFFTSYYIAYMIGIFAFLYFTCSWFASSDDLRAYGKKLLRFIATAALAAGCCAFLLLPAFFGLRNGQSEMWNIDINFTLERSFVRIASRLLPGVYDSLTDSGYPNIYCTIPAVMLCLCYFFHHGIARREKLLFGGLLGFLLFSFSCNFFYLAWHAFEPPTWFPARFSFLFSFLILWFAMRAADKQNGLTTAAIANSGILLLALVLEVSTQGYHNISIQCLVIATVLIIAYGALGIMAQKYPRTPWIVPLMLIMVCAELWGNAYTIELGLDDEFYYKTRNDYYSYRNTLTPALEQLAENDDSVYRTEVMQLRNANGGMALGYNGISHYSTTTDQNLNTFLRLLGYNKGTINELRFSVSTPLTNGLLGIKYVLSQDDMGEGYQLTEQVNTVGIYENEYSFPLAYWAPTLPETVTQTVDSFALQNELLEKLSLSEDVFIPINDVQEKLLYIDFEDCGNYLLYTPQNSSATIEYTIQNPEGKPAYAYFPVWNNHFSSASIYVNGEYRWNDLRYRSNAIIPLGTNKEITVTIDLDDDAAHLLGTYFYFLDEDAATAAREQTNTNAMQFTVFEDTEVAGEFTAPQDGYLVTTFPLDDGWTVAIDGKKADTTSFAGVFMAVPVSAGTHTVAMHYMPSGFVAGWIISILSIGASIVYWQKSSKRK